jgi:plastocyanin
MRRLLTFVLAGLTVAGATVALAQIGEPAPAAATQGVVVSMIGNRFVPETITIAAGTTVTWTNDDFASGEYHDVIAEDGSFISATYGPGEAYSVSFDFPGAYGYYCDLHEGMYGRVIVQ